MVGSAGREHTCEDQAPPTHPTHLNNSSAGINNVSPDNQVGQQANGGLPQTPQKTCETHSGASDAYSIAQQEVPTNIIHDAHPPVLSLIHQDRSGSSFASAQHPPERTQGEVKMFAMQPVEQDNHQAITTPDRSSSVNDQVTDLIHDHRTPVTNDGTIARTVLRPVHYSTSHSNSRVDLTPKAEQVQPRKRGRVSPSLDDESVEVLYHSANRPLPRMDFKKFSKDGLPASKFPRSALILSEFRVPRPNSQMDTPPSPGQPVPQKHRSRVGLRSNRRGSPSARMQKYLVMSNPLCGQLPEQLPGLLLTPSSLLSLCSQLYLN